MTQRLSVFDSPFLLGFDQFERALDRISKASDSYPPYNIEQIGEDRLRISIAVAGFTMGDLSVQLEQSQLLIRGKRDQKEDEDKIYLHRGIATRQFQRAFVLSEEIEVTGATLDNGLLHIDMTRILPERNIQTIEIQSSSGHKSNGNAIDIESGEEG